MMNKRLFPFLALFLVFLWLVNPIPAFSTQPNLPNAPLGSGFTYQGYLKDASGNPIHDTCDLRFSLWDAINGGAQIGADSTVTGVSVNYGYFSAQVNVGGEFGAQPFDNANAHWLEVEVKCSGDASYTALTPRQEVSWTPPTHDHWAQYWSGSGGTGLHLWGADTGLDASGTNIGVTGWSTSSAGRGVYGLAMATTGFTYGLFGASESTQGYGVYGIANASTGGNYGVYGYSNSISGRGVFGWAGAGSGVTHGVYGYSSSTSGRGVSGIAIATTGTTYGVFGRSNSTEGNGVYGSATATTGTTFGVYGLSNSTEGSGVYGSATATTGTNVGVYGASNSYSGYGVFGHATDTLGTNYGVYGRSDSVEGHGVYGYAYATVGVNYGVYGETNSFSGRGVYGFANTTTGTGYGVYGQSSGQEGRGVVGYASATTGVTYGVVGASNSTIGTGVWGIATAHTGSNVGVLGESDSTAGRGVYGVASATTGVNYGVVGQTNSPNGFAGWFSGDVHVNGDLSASGTKPFKIDHPLDPANQYLYHYSVESPEVLNQYTGNVTLDANGEAWVELLKWFEALNTDFRYQLTPIGGFAPLYIVQEIQDNRFKIAGGEPGMKVSWMVIALRNDPYLQQYPQPVEQPKSPEQQGLYLHPELYGQPAEQGIGYLSPPGTDQPALETPGQVE